MFRHSHSHIMPTSSLHTLLDPWPPSMPLCLLSGPHTWTSRTHTLTRFPFCQTEELCPSDDPSHSRKHNHTKLNIDTQLFTLHVFFLTKAEKKYIYCECTSSRHRQFPNVSLMWFVYVFILCLCVHARVLCILTDICLPLVKGVKTSGFCFNPNRRQMMFHPSLHLTVGVCKSVCLGCAATTNPTLSPNFRRTFSTDWVNFSQTVSGSGFRPRGLAECKFELRKNMCLYLMKWVCTLWVSLTLSYFTQFDGFCVFHPCMYMVPVIDIVRENRHVRLIFRNDGCLLQLSTYSPEVNKAAWSPFSHWIYHWIAVKAHFIALSATLRSCVFGTLQAAEWHEAATGGDTWWSGPCRAKPGSC